MPVVCLTVLKDILHQEVKSVAGMKSKIEKGFRKV